MAGEDIATDLSFWRDEGFDIHMVETAFVFDSIAEANRLLSFYFGDRARPALRVGYRVAVMLKESAR